MEEDWEDGQFADADLIDHYKPLNKAIRYEENILPILRNIQMRNIIPDKILCQVLITISQSLNIIIQTPG